MPHGVGAQRGAVASGSAYDDEEVHGGHGELGDDGAPGGASDAEARAVHEAHIEDAVGDETADGDVQRGFRVLQAAQHTGGGEHDEHGRNAERGDAEIRDRVRGGGVRCAEELDERGRGGQDGGDDGGAE